MSTQIINNESLTTDSKNSSSERKEVKPTTNGIRLAKAESLGGGKADIDKLKNKVKRSGFSSKPGARPGSRSAWVADGMFSTIMSILRQGFQNELPVIEHYLDTGVDQLAIELKRELTKLRDEYKQDLTQQGVEPNPGPDCLFSQHTESHVIVKHNRHGSKDNEQFSEFRKLRRVARYCQDRNHIMQLNIKRSWVRDLTIEGIEANPGPGFEDKVNSRRGSQQIHKIDVLLPCDKDGNVAYWECFKRLMVVGRFIGHIANIIIVCLLISKQTQFESALVSASRVLELQVHKDSILLGDNGWKEYLQRVNNHESHSLNGNIYQTSGQANVNISSTPLYLGTNFNMTNGDEICVGISGSGLTSGSGIQVLLKHSGENSGNGFIIGAIDGDGAVVNFGEPYNLTSATQQLMCRYSVRTSGTVQVGLATYTSTNTVNVSIAVRPGVTPVDICGQGMGPDFQVDVRLIGGYGFNGPNLPIDIHAQTLANVNTQVTNSLSSGVNVNLATWGEVIPTAFTATPLPVVAVGANGQSLTSTIGGVNYMNVSNPFVRIVSSTRHGHVKEIEWDDAQAVAPTSGGWVRDLTSEGVEPNPGPPPMGIAGGLKINADEESAGKGPVSPARSVYSTTSGIGKGILEIQNNLRNLLPDETDELDEYIRHELSQGHSFNQYVILTILDGEQKFPDDIDIDDIPTTTIDVNDHTPNRDIKFHEVRQKLQAIEHVERKEQKITKRVQKHKEKKDIKVEEEQVKKVMGMSGAERRLYSKEARDALAARVRKRITNVERLAHWIAHQQPAIHEVEAVMKELNLHIEDKGVYGIFVKNYLKPHSKSEQFWSYINDIQCLKAAQSSPAWENWLALYGIKRIGETESDYEEDLTREGIEPNPGPVIRSEKVLASEADKHNKEMHSLNGNVATIARDMHEIEQSTPLDKVWENSNESNQKLDPVEIVSRVTGIIGPEGAVSSYIPSQGHLRVQIVGANNTINGYYQIPGHEAQLSPMWATNGNLTRATNRMISIGTTIRHARGISMEKEAEEFMVLSMTRGMKGNVMGSRGFSQEDIVAKAWGVKDLIAPPGDSMLAPFLKLCLLSKILNWGAPTNMLPLGHQISITDPGGVLQQNTTVGLTYNVGNSVQDAQQGAPWCTAGGANSVLPFGSAARPATAILINGTTPAVGSGGVSFHVSLDSVPLDERDNVIAIDSATCQSGESGPYALNLVLLALMFSVYPVGWWGVDLSVQQIAGTQTTKIRSYLSMANQIKISGLTTIRFLLPCRCAHPTINNAQQAASYSLITPITGPTASTTLTANTPLNISFPGTLYTYSLAEWLYTFLANPTANNLIDQLSIQRFLYTQAELTNRYSDLQAAQEMASVLSCRYLPLFSLAPGGSNYWDVTTPHLNHAGFEVYDYGTNFTAAQYDDRKYEFIIPGISESWYTRVAMGVIKPAAMGMREDSRSGDLIGSPYQLMYDRFIFRSVAAVMHVFYRQVGFPVSLWNSAFTQVYQIKARDIIRQLFIDSAKNDADIDSPNWMVAPLGFYLNGLHARLTGFMPRGDSFSNNWYYYLNVPRTLMRGPSTSVPYASINTVLPSYMTDPEMISVLKVIPRGLQPFLLPLHGLRGIHDNNARVLMWAAGLKSMPVKPERQNYNIGINEVPIVDDIEMFNKRLVWHCTAFGATQFYDVSGNLINADTIPSGNILVRGSTANNVFDWTVPNPYVSGMAVANTSFMPIIDANGKQILVGANTQNGSDTMTQVMAGIIPTSVETIVWPHMAIMPNTVLGGGVNSIPFLRYRGPDIGGDKPLNLQADSAPAAEESA